ncbi:glycosyltransferase family 2 protein [Kutzneria sp. CA-103260]|uniref:glycosyltransferase family 2 protein n=1 Tax=Kutzneria sp. CA-103260 TaxID=2802641 RepID=UPI001BA96E91|nr:glycosyltransferase family 2 protein [Kutzneria sp. CA-103260]QUQ67947.1 Glycosyl transferase family 2 [Kutzneria sp. CA-103260]
MITSSVVICCYTERRWDDIVDAVKSLTEQTVAPHEVLLVVDHNEDLKRRAEGAFDAVKVLANKRSRGLSGARNTGVDHAVGEVVAFLDDDARADPQWLQRMLEPYADPAVAAVGGKAYPVWPDGTAPSMLPPELGWVVGCSFTGQPTEPAEVRNVMGCAMSFRRDLVLELGGFAEWIGRIGTTPLGCEETELCIRLRQRFPGRKVLLRPDATVRHRVTADRTTWRYLARRSWAEGLSKAAISQLVGAQDALSTEQSYVRVTIPKALLREVGRPAFGALLLTPFAAGVGYLKGKMSKLTREIPVAAPAKPDRTEDAPPEPAQWPSVSVVIATAGRVDHAERCVRSVLDTRYPDLEIVIVDNHGQANRDLARLAEMDQRVRYLREAVPGASRARNAGAAAARGEVLAFTDDDAVVDERWLAEAVAEIEAGGADCVTGLVLPKSLDTQAQQWFEAFGGFGKGFERRRFGPDEPVPDALYPLSPGIFGSGNNMVWRRDSFRRLGGFDERLGPGRATKAGEDLDLYLRLITADGRLDYTPNALVWHEHRETLPELRKQLRGYGTGLAATFLLHAMRPGGGRQIAQRLRLGLRLLFAADSSKNAQRGPDFPRKLVFDELYGMTLAPWRLTAELVKRWRR